MSLPNSLKVNFTFLEEMAVLRPKDSFGELSLVQKQSLPVCFRAKTEVRIARISRADYAPLVKDAMAHKSLSFRATLLAIPFFKAFQAWAIEKMAGAIRTKKYSRKQFVYKEGEDVDNLYIVKEGEFEQTKQFSIVADVTGSTHLQSIVPGALGDCFSLEAEGSPASKSTDPSSQPPPVPESSPRSPMRHLNNKVGEKSIKLKSIGVSELFGEDEIVMKSRIRQSTVQCAGPQGVLYAISKEALNEAIKNSASTERLQKYVEEDISAVKQKLGTVSKYTSVKLPKIQLLRARRKFKPLSTEERKEIRRKLNAFDDRKLITEIKKSFPRYSMDLTYQCYDSKVIRGEREPITLNEMLKQKRPPVDFELQRVAENAPKARHSSSINVLSSAAAPVAERSAEAEADQSRRSPSPRLRNQNRLRYRRDRSESIRRQAGKDLEEMLARTEDRGECILRHQRSSSTFVTSINIQSSAPEKDPPIQITPKLKPQAAGRERNAAISQALTDVAAEMVEQYKVMNHGSVHVERGDVPTVLGSMLQSNKYLQNLVKSVRFVQRKCEHKMLKSKHNMYRFKSIS